MSATPERAHVAVAAERPARATDAAAVETVIRDLRERISNVDRTIVSSLNKRIELVLRLKRYKEAHGRPFVEPQQEEWIFRDLARFNRGPLSDEELTRLVGEILALTKREVERP